MEDVVTLMMGEEINRIIIWIVEAKLQILVLDLRARSRADHVGPTSWQKD